MRAVIAVPSVTDFYFTPHRASALGARAVETVLKTLGWETELIDFPGSARKGSPLPLPRELSHLEPFILPDETGPTTFFKQYYRFGPPSHKAAEAMLARRPDAVLVSCFAWAYAEETRDLIRAIKTAAPGLPVIVGGAGASVLPDYFSDADHVLCGEAEVQLPGVWQSSSVPRIMPFDPDRAADTFPVPWGATHRGRIPQVNLHLSRGCPMGCRFCSNHLTVGRRFRTARPSELKKTLEEIGTASKAEEPIIFNLEDDNLLLDFDYFLAALDAIRRHFPRAIFRSENGLDYRLMTAEIMGALIDHGYDQFNLSVVQAGGAILQGQKRTFERQRFEELLSLAASRGIRTISYFIAGLPGDSRENLLDNLGYLSSLPTDIGISLFYPIPGLPGFEDPAPFLAVPPKLCAGSSAWPWAGSLSTAEMITAFRLARMINFLKRRPRNQREAEQREELLEKRRLLTWRKGTLEGIAPPGIEDELSSSFMDSLW